MTRKSTMSRLPTVTSILLAILAALAARSFAASAGGGLPLSKGESCPFQVSTDHFDIEFSVPPAVGRGYGTLCEKAYAKFCDIFQVPEEEKEKVWEGKCHIVLFANRDQFVKYAAETHGGGAAISGGYTLPSKQRPIIVLFLQGKDHIKLQQTLIHEMTHVFVQLFHKEVHINTWLHEGFAQYFEFQHHPGDSRLQTSRNVVRRLVRSGSARPLKDFWVESFPATNLAGYAEAWSLVNFMAQSKEMRKKLGKFVLALKDTAPEQRGFMTIQNEADIEKLIKEEAEKQFKLQADTFKDVFGISVEEFEAKWKRYVLAGG